MKILHANFIKKSLVFSGLFFRSLETKKWLFQNHLGPLASYISFFVRACFEQD
jgi:hypothetical protein